VVLCFITPGSTVKAYVTISSSFVMPLDSNRREFMGSLLITSSNGSFIELEKSQDNPLWFVDESSSFQIIKGEKYFLSVIDVNRRVISVAEAVVPEKADSMIYCKYASFSEDGQESQYTVKAKWERKNRFNNILGYAVVYNPLEVPSSLSLDYDSNQIQVNDSIFEYVIADYWCYKSYFTLFTLNESFDSYMSSYIIFYDLGIDVSFQDLMNTYNGIIPEYTNFDNSLGVFGAYLTDTISALNPYPSPY